MAINERSEVDCAANWQHAPGHPAVAFIIGDSMGSDGEWWPRCQACLDQLAADPDPFPHDVVYFGPAADQHPAGPANLDPAGAVLDRPERDPARPHPAATI